MIYTKTTTIKDALIENNQIVSQALNKLWAAKVNKAPSDDDPTREKVLSDFNFDLAYKTKLDDLEATITEAIEALDVTDTANEREYVASVNEVDGKIIVERAEHLGGIKTLLDTGIDETDPYNTKFLYTNNEGRLVYYSLSTVREDQTVSLASAAQLCTAPVMSYLNAYLNIQAQNPMIIGNISDHEYLLIRSGSALNSIVIDHMVDGASESQFYSETGTWNAGVPTLTLTANILKTVAKTGFDLNKIINPQATFDKQVVILRNADVTDDYEDKEHPTPSEKCLLVSRAGVERIIREKQAAIDALEQRLVVLEEKQAAIDALEQRLVVLENAHRIAATQGSSLFALDADGNLINAVVIDEKGNEVPVEIVKQGD